MKPSPSWWSKHRTYDIRCLAHEFNAFTVQDTSSWNQQLPKATFRRLHYLVHEQSTLSPDGYGERTSIAPSSIPRKFRSRACLLLSIIQLTMPPTGCQTLSLILRRSPVHHTSDWYTRRPPRPLQNKRSIFQRPDLSSSVGLISVNPPTMHQQAIP